MDDNKSSRPLGLGSLLALGINGIVGVGIFFTPNEIAKLAPGWTAIAVVAITGLALMPVALAVATVGRRFDEDGGPVLYARVAFGEAAGFIVGWLAYTASLFSVSAVLTGFMGAVAPAFLPENSSKFATTWIVRGAAIGLLSVLSVIASLGVKLSARIWSGLTVLKMLPLVLLAVVASFLPAASGPVSLAPIGETHWLRAALMATFIFQGFDIVPVVAGQAKGSARAIPIAVLGSLAISIVLYVALFRGAVAGVPDLAHNGEPLVATAVAYGGTRLAWLIRSGLNVSSLGIAFGMVVMTPRFLSALAPQSRFGKGDANGVPQVALWTTWIIVTVLVLLGSLGELLTLASLSVVMQYLLIALALAKFAFKRERDLTPLRAWSAVPTVIVALALISAAKQSEWVVAIGCAAVGAALYAYFAGVSRIVVARIALAVGMTIVGILHFVNADWFTAIVPAWLPAPHLLVLVSGFFEAAGGIGLSVPRVRKLASWGLIALFVAVFPANINMVIHPELGGGMALWALYARLPLQAVFIYWAWRVGKQEAPTS